MIVVLLSRRLLRPFAIIASAVAIGLLFAGQVVRAQSLRIATTPTVRINSPETGTGMFETVVGATRLPDGRIVVGNRGEHALLVFSATGVFERALARKGRGPGEVTSLLALYRCGDRIITSDITGDRMQIFSPALGFERAFRFHRNAYRRACNASGQFMHMGWDEGSSDAPSRRPISYWMTPSDSSAGTPLGTFAGDERIANMPQPLGASPRITIGRDRAYIALSDSLSVLAFTFDAAPAPTLRAPFERARVTTADIEAALNRDVQIVGEKARPMLAAIHARAPKKSLLPATRDMIVDAEGLIWIQRYPEAGKPLVMWTVFHPNGRVVGIVPLPRDLVVYEIGRSHLLGSTVDPATELPQVLLYAISR